MVQKDQTLEQKNITISMDVKTRLFTFQFVFARVLKNNKQQYKVYSINQKTI